MRIILPLLLLQLVIGMALAAPKAGPPSIVGPATVRLIESKVVMPPRADPLADYDRYYMLSTFSPKGMAARDVVEGRFMLRREFAQKRTYGVAVPGVPGAFTVARDGRLPNVADGGCAVVTIFFDVQTSDFVRIQEEGREDEPDKIAVCNGYG
jgi:hypothetical protein